MTVEEIVAALDQIHSILEQITSSQTFRILAEHPEFHEGDVTLGDCLHGVQEVSGAIGYVVGFEIHRNTIPGDGRND